jgi:hypothetical protein
VQRGDVYLIRLTMPGRAGAAATVRAKYVVVLQGGRSFAGATDVAVLVASTHRRDSVRPFEVLVGTADGFAHETVIDCRWPFTLLKDEVQAGNLKFTLSGDRMREVALGLVHGLQLT